MKVLTKKYIVLEHQIVRIVLDPNEYLLQDTSGDANVKLKSQLGEFIKNPNLRFIGLEFYIDVDAKQMKRLGGVIPTPEVFEKKMQQMIKYDFLDLREYM